MSEKLDMLKPTQFGIAGLRLVECFLCLLFDLATFGWVFYLLAALIAWDVSPVAWETWLQVAYAAAVAIGWLTLYPALIEHPMPTEPGSKTRYLNWTFAAKRVATKRPSIVLVDHIGKDDRR